MKSTLERRHVLRAAGAAGATAVAGLALADSARADDGGSAVMGAWLITHQDNPPGDPTPGKGVVTFAAGGVFASVELSQPGAGAGSWTALGDGRFKAVFMAAFPGATPTDPVAIAEVKPRGRVRGNMISGTYTLKITNASTGAVLFSGTGTFEGTRLNP